MAMRSIIALAALLPLLGLGQVNGQVPDYRRDAAATRVLVERAVSIKSGDPKSAVLAKLGAPDADRVLMKKERPEVVGHTMTYEIVKWKRGLVNEITDEYVEVWLDPKFLVKSVTIRANISGK
jgi:hypothetical protein